MLAHRLQPIVVLKQLVKARFFNTFRGVTYFYASAIDEEDTFITYTTPVVVSDTVIQGTVTAVDEEEFVINTGLRLIDVEVDEMAYNPLDNIGYQKIEVGDRVSVTGEMDLDIFEGEREFVAESVITLSN